MQTDDDFLAAIAREPEKNELRLVYADFLEERGDERGEYVRLEASWRAMEDRLDASGADAAWRNAVRRRWSVQLDAVGRDTPIATIKCVREVTLLGLKEAKDIVDAARAGRPSLVTQPATRGLADAAARWLSQPAGSRASVVVSSVVDAPPLEGPERALLDALVAQPGDDTARLAYWAWLDERGDARASFVRDEVGAARSWARLRALSERLPAAWLTAMTRLWRVRVAGDAPGEHARQVNELTRVAYFEQLLGDAVGHRVVDGLREANARALVAKLEALGAHVELARSSAWFDWPVGLVGRAKS